MDEIYTWNNSRPVKSCDFKLSQVLRFLLHSDLLDKSLTFKGQALLLSETQSQFQLRSIKISPLFALSILKLASIVHGHNNGTNRWLTEGIHKIHWRFVGKQLTSHTGSRSSGYVRKYLSANSTGVTVRNCKFVQHLRNENTLSKAYNASRSLP